MCGIAGYYSFDGAASPEALTAMLDAIVHRGPDDRGTFAEGPVVMGMNRLAIIDLAGGRQPMTNEDGSVTLVFNGEVYDYRETAEALRRAGHRLRTESDTEVVAHLYEDHGDGCVHRLRGMFAFALWDGPRRRLLLARDRLGIKPLYYAQTRDGLVFASEIKALLRHPDVRAELDPEALGLYLSLKYVPAPLTLFAGIRSLPPAHTLVCDEDGVRVERYWDLRFADAPEPGPDGRLESAEEAADRLDALLRETVAIHLRSDVPFGAFLSGGVDSSLVVALMSRLLDEPVRTFALGFETAGGEGSELPYARTVAEALGTEHHEVVIGPSDFIADAERVMWHLDQPIADQATVATYRLAAAARAEVKMVLTGEGGDELFAGYARYAGERWSPLFGAIPGPLRAALWEAARRAPGMRRAKIALYALLQQSEAARFANWFPLFNDRALRAVLSPEMRAATLPDGAERLFAGYLARVESKDPVQRMLYADTQAWLPDFLLLRGDKLTMARSLEARVPLLDHVLAEFAASRPSSEKVRGGARKYLLKQVARRYLPAEIVDRPKQGFPVPIGSWFRKEARDFVRDLLAPGAVHDRGLFDVAEVERLLGEHERGFADHSALIWGLASVELWHRVFIDDPEPTRYAADPLHGRAAAPQAYTEVNP